MRFFLKKQQNSIFFVYFTKKVSKIQFFFVTLPSEMVK